ncbi:ABC transporter substrate-binding protein [Acidocella sp.]|uniref:ABC transporter substrate-binding protein n=1 Tax=Acidocella sp. TaxID=50710 RepID=UPI003CFE719F
MTNQSADIPIGSMVPLTGAVADDGIAFRNGAIMAIEEINATGGILGRKLYPYFVDTGPQTAASVIAAANTLIHRHKVHAIINGYNIGPQNAEYEPIADAGIIYIHQNTLLQHHDTINSDRDRYFGCFMGDPADYWYGQGFIKFLSWLRDTKQWTPRNNRLAIISGSKPYSIVIAKAMEKIAHLFGWQVAYGPRIVQTPTTSWRDVIEEVRAADPAAIANTHFYAGDLAHFQLQFSESPINALVYLQYGAMHDSFVRLASTAAEGVIVGTVVGLLPDAIGQAFEQRYHARFGDDSTARIAGQVHAAVHHYAIAAALAGGTAPPGGQAQNRLVAARLRSTIYRSVIGSVNYDRNQAATSYPNATNDPSLGLPHLFYQIQGPYLRHSAIAPHPYDITSFKLPSWFR